jgi:hypothetical protein
MPDSQKSIKFIKSKLKEFWLKNEAKIILVFGFLLVSVVAFEFGLMQGQKWQQKPLIIEKTASAEAPKGEAVNLATPDPKPAPEASLASKKDCAFIGSKNSNKFHLPTCSFAKRIKPENVVCFKSAEDAAAKNYLPDKGCIK